MKYFFIEPEDKHSISTRWFTDEEGFKAVQYRYQNYNKDPNNIVNRWHEFKYTEVKEVKIDFGGMISLDEPFVNVRDGDVTFKMLATHLEIFIDVLESSEESYRYPNVMAHGMPWWNICLSLDTVKRILPTAKQLLVNCEEMIEGAERDFQNKLNIIRKMGGNVISARDKEMPNE